MNSLRYRGYVYDRESGLYYLQSRYYDPLVGRFVNADRFVYTTNVHGINVFVYCGNNPISFDDSTGEWFGIDDVVTGPVDEIIVLGGLALLAALGIDWAEDAGDSLSAALDAALADITATFAKPSRESGKEKASDKPSWVNKDMVDPNLSAEENARRILNDKYGPGKWKKGSNTEFNKIKKWLTRTLKLKSLTNNDDDIIIIDEDGNMMIIDPDMPWTGWYNGQRICFQ